MIPQRTSKLLPTIVTLIAAWYAVSHPIQAAHLVHQAATAVTVFMGAL